MLHSELLRSGEYVVWVCLMGLVMPQTVLCQAELTDLWSLVCRKNMIVPVSAGAGWRDDLVRSVAARGKGSEGQFCTRGRIFA